MKIQSLKDRNEREKRNRRIGGIVIISILLLSTVGFAVGLVGFGTNTVPEEVQGFQHNGQYWVYTAGSQKYYFTHHIQEINNTFDISKNLADFSNQQIYIDSSNGQALQEVYTNLGSYAQIYEACYGACTRDLPEKSCMEEPLIVIRDSQTEAIREENNCIFIEGNMKTVDAFLYKILGIQA